MSAEFSYEKLQEKLSFYLKHNRNVLLEGRHGTAKTTMISKIFNEEIGEGKWLYFSASTLDPWVDFVGVPRVVEDSNGDQVIDFVRPKAMNNDTVEAIYIDEYNRSDKKFRNAVLELIQFKSINGKKFNKLRVIWAAVNPFSEEEMEESYDVDPIDPAQLDRFHIQLSLPFAPDFKYFSEKFGEEWAKSAIEWWNALDQKMKDKISPRRLDYALEIAQIEGELIDVLPFESNPQKLELLLKVGNIEELLFEFIEKGDYDKAKEFINKENNFQGSKKYICEFIKVKRFFLPLLDQERLCSLFFSNESVKEFVLKNPLYFVDALKEILEANPDGKYTYQIKSALKHVSGVQFQS